MPRNNRSGGSGGRNPIPGQPRMSRTLSPDTEGPRPAGGTTTPQQTLRNPSQDKNHWSNADYGQRFGRGDIRRLQDQGFNTNQVMKIAKMAYAGGAGNINKINKTNDALTKLGQSAMAPGTYQVRNIGDGSMSTRNFFTGTPRSRVLGWEGFDSSLSVNTLGKGGRGPEYSRSGSWDVPSAYRSGGGAATGGNTTGGGTTAGGTGTGTGAGEVLPNDYTPPTDTVAAENTDPIGMMSGGGAGINSATGLRRKKSSAKQSGASTRGTNQFNRGLSINSFNV